MIRHLDVEFESGLTILTGETGAGKSILIEALGLSLGDRADSAMVRSTADRASVSATFDITGNETLKAFLRTNDLEDDSECILRRVLGADGRSRAFCNASPVPVQLLKQIGEFLVDIHGQHAHQSLLRRPTQRELLDEFAQCSEQVVGVEKAYREWYELGRRLEELSDGTADVPSRIDLLRFQVSEIEALNVSVESLSALESEHRRVASAERIIEGCEAAAAHMFDADGSALPSAIKAAGALRELREVDDAIPAVVDLIDQAVIHLEEAERELGRLRANIDADPRRLREIDRQLQSIQDVARKHRCEATALPNRLDGIKAELDELGNREKLFGQLTTALADAVGTYEAAAMGLHDRRAAAGDRMSGEISRRLRELGIPYGEFSVRVAKHEGPPSQHGQDDIEFLVTANPDLPLRPLKKVASGGELSRISLAIQVAAIGGSGVPSLVFDEVDSGIGGPTAEIVSEYLAALAERRQILCITHLPQVASAGDHHLTIGKIVAGGMTETTISSLAANERIEEIARMLGGQRITEKAREHARELLAN